MKLRIAYVLAIFVASLATMFFFAWDKGFDVGERAGWNTAMIMGKIEVSCKFERNWEKHCGERKDIR